MRARKGDRPGWGYYAAIVLFIGILAFAVLGLVRSSSLAGASTQRSGGPPTPTPGAIRLAREPIATPQIPPPTPSEPTKPPSRTYLYPPPASRPPDPGGGPLPADASPRR